jgi:hypothetical protein
MSSNSNSNSNSDSGSSPRPGIQETPDPTSVKASTSVKVTESKDAKKTENELEQQAARLMGELDEKIKKGHLENAVGISNLLNVLHNNVKILNNFLVKSSSNNVKEALNAAHRAQNELIEDPDDPKLKQKEISANKNLVSVLKKEKNFLEVYIRESQGTVKEKLYDKAQKVGVMGEKIAGGFLASRPIYNAVKSLWNLMTEGKANSDEQKSLTDAPKSKNNVK